MSESVKQRQKRVTALVQRCDKLDDAGRFREEIRILRQALRIIPDDHYLLARISNAYYDLDRIGLAMKYSVAAMRQSPRCPRVIWEHAGNLAAVGQYRRAIRLLEELVSRDVAEVAYGECGDGLRHARVLINDCYYQLSRIYGALGEIEPAAKYLRRHDRGRARAGRSAYSAKEVAAWRDEVRAAAARLAAVRGRRGKISGELSRGGLK